MNNRVRNAIRSSHNLLIAGCVATSLVACSDGSDGPLPGAASAPTAEALLNTELREIVQRQNLTGNPAQGRELPDISDPLPQLGMNLFFSKALSGDRDTACVSCHHPTLGGGDGLSLPVGVHADNPELIGPGRTHSSAAAGFDGGPTVPRNAPTTFNLALWDATLFHDGRIESLGKTAGVNGADGQGIRTPDAPFGVADAAALNLSQAQAMFPVTSGEEMRSDFLAGQSNTELREALVERLVSQEIPNTWLDEFQRAFDSSDDADTLMTFANIVFAIGEYERSQVFVDTPWRAFVEGDDDALTLAQKRGAKLFYQPVSEGGAACAGCHSGDFFTDEGFHVVAMPQLGRGKGDGDTGNDDFGRFRETGESQDRYAFRTPSLLNVTVMGPYGHAGAYRDLAAVVRHHANPAAAVANYDFTLAELDPGIQKSDAQSNTEAAVAQLEALRAEGNSQLPLLELSDTDVDDLVAFMEALTDPCVTERECIGQWIPDTSATGPDNLQLNGVNREGQTL